MSYFLKHNILKNLNYLWYCKLCVRWATKPRWIPIAKSKAFRVHSRGVEPEYEKEEKTKLFHHYKTQMKGVRQFLNDLYKENETSDEVISMREKQKEQDWMKCMAQNDEWNLKVKIEREQKDSEEFNLKVEEAHLKMKQEDEKLEIEKRRVEALIKKEEEFSKHFITSDNIDEHITKILHKIPPQTFNFAIDLEGKIYRGYSMTATNDHLANQKLDEMLTNIKEDQIESLKHS